MGLFGRSDEPRCRHLQLSEVGHQIFQREQLGIGHCPGQKQPQPAVESPLRPSRSAIQSRSTMGNAKGA